MRQRARRSRRCRLRSTAWTSAGSSRCERRAAGAARRNGLPAPCLAVCAGPEHVTSALSSATMGWGSLIVLHQRVCDRSSLRAAQPAHGRTAHCAGRNPRPTGTRPAVVHAPFPARCTLRKRCWASGLSAELAHTCRGLRQPFLAVPFANINDLCAASTLHAGCQKAHTCCGSQ